MPSEITIALIGALAGLLPAGLTAVFTWLDKRGREARQDRVLQLAHKRVEFLQTWLEVQQSVCDGAQLAQIKASVFGELNDLRGLLPSAIADDEPADMGERNFVQRLLLIYRPQSVLASVLHTLFYMLIGIIVFVYYATITAPASQDVALGARLAGATILIVPVIIAMAIIRWIARSTDRKLLEQPQ